jgi:hypothetical protein
MGDVELQFLRQGCRCEPFFFGVAVQFLDKTDPLATSVPVHRFSSLPYCNISMQA